MDNLKEIEKNEEENHETFFFSEKDHPLQPKISIQQLIHTHTHTHTKFTLHITIILSQKEYQIKKNETSSHTQTGNHRDS